MRRLIAAVCCLSTWACTSSSSGSSGSSGSVVLVDTYDAGPPNPDAGRRALTYAELPAPALPQGASTVDALAFTADETRLVLGAGARLFTADLSGPGGRFALLADLTAEGITKLDAVRPLSSGDTAVLGGGRFVRLDSTGHSSPARSLAPAGFSGAWALSVDGFTVALIESGPGSVDPDGQARVHVARWDLALPGEPVPVAETFALTAPFRIAPVEVGAIDADAPVFASDGSLYFAHVVYRTVYRLAFATHLVEEVDTQSLQRSATAMALSPAGVVAQVATFDQTLPVFQLTGGTQWSVVTELPAGQNLGAVACSKNLVIASQGGFTGFPTLPDGGFPGFPGDGGFPGLPGDGGFPGFPGSDGGAVSLRVFLLGGLPGAAP